jgi:hypothetical protein
VKRGSAAQLRPCWRQGASQGNDSVLADSGREGEIIAGVGRVRSPAFLNILLGIGGFGERLGDSFQW